MMRSIIAQALQVLLSPTALQVLVMIRSTVAQALQVLLSPTALQVLVMMHSTVAQALYLTNMITHIILEIAQILM